MGVHVILDFGLSGDSLPTVFNRSRSERAVCGLGGFHKIRTPRLVLRTARRNEYRAAQRQFLDEAAQHWLGWSDEDLVRLTVRDSVDPLIWSAEQAGFLAWDTATKRAVAQVTLFRPTDDRVEVGALVDPARRGTGVGREALRLLCVLAHQHFGIVTLNASCEDRNQASRNWLTSCGFVPDLGPAGHTLPNGRAITALWWQHRDSNAQRRCRN
jgi:RimJ/RimL family protein N-acetyltransferase